MRVLVTGADGQLGREVVDVFSAKEHHEVIGCNRDVLDLSKRDSVLATITSAEPDVIVHAGAFTAVDRCESEANTAFAVNAMGTRHVVDAASRIGAKVIYISTDYVFDGQKTSAYNEWDAPNPQSVYGLSKLGGESELRPEDVIVRTAWVFGQHGANMVKTILRLLAEDAPLRFVDDQTGSPTCAADLAEALYDVVVNRLTGRFHLTNSGVTNWCEFAKGVATAGGFDPERVTAIKTADMQPARPAQRPVNSVLDNAAWKSLGFAELPHFYNAIERTVKQLQ